MKVHAGDLIAFKLGESHYLSGIVSKVTYANEEDYKNEKPLYINISCYRRKIYVSELEGKEVYVVPVRKIDKMIVEFGERI